MEDEQDPAVCQWLSATLSDADVRECSYRDWCRPPVRQHLGFAGADFVFVDPRFRIRYFFNSRLQTVTGLIRFTKDCEGPARCVHGGCIALCFDEIVPFLMLVHERICFTASLSIRYLSMLPCPSVIQYTCRIISQEGKRMRTEARLLSLQPQSSSSSSSSSNSSNSSGPTGEAAHQLYATCEGEVVHSLRMGDPFDMARAVTARL